MSRASDQDNSENEDIDQLEPMSESADSEVAIPPETSALQQGKDAALDAIKLIPFVDRPLSPLKSNEDAPPSRVSDGQERLIAERVEDHRANRALRNRFAAKAYNP